jgi:predicted nucleotidyltransferase
MTPTHGLSPKTIAAIQSVLTRFPEVERALLFGSRAKGTHKPGSDIDLALIGEALDWRKLGQIDDALDDLLLPYCFSLVDYGDRTDPELAAHIQRIGQPIYERAPAPA